MTKILYWIIVLPIFLAVIVFSVNNRAVTPIDLWPAPYTIDLPVFAVALLGVFVGFIWGGFVAWIHAGKTRQKVRDLYRRVEGDRRERAILQTKVSKLERAEKAATAPPPSVNAA